MAAMCLDLTHAGTEQGLVLVFCHFVLYSLPADLPLPLPVKMSLSNNLLLLHQNVWNLPYMLKKLS